MGIKEGVLPLVAGKTKRRPLRERNKWYEFPLHNSAENVPFLIGISSWLDQVGGFDSQRRTRPNVGRGLGRSCPTFAQRFRNLDFR